MDLHEGQFGKRSVDLTELITTHAAMTEVLASGRTSDTPDQPVWLKIRGDGAGLEIADGHHRVADALRRGERSIAADVDPVPDDEPYLPPFFDFRQAIRSGTDEDSV